MAKSNINNKAPSRNVISGFWVNLTQIRWAVMFIFLIWTGIVLVVMYINSISLIQDSQNKLSSDLISGLDVFRTDANMGKFEALQPDINGILQVNNGFEPYIRYTLVTDLNMKKLYSNLPKSVVVSTNNNKPGTLFFKDKSGKDFIDKRQIIYIPYY